MSYDLLIVFPPFPLEMATLTTKWIHFKILLKRYSQPQNPEIWNNPEKYGISKPWRQFNHTSLHIFGTLFAAITQSLHMR